ncbi:MAG: FtsQ-type POTRA domain-containing protein [Alicyclobacillus sp.]|nr:FtsQ-type POTRA domain-containing protein [Alicyclobacillus sp.]
MPKTKTVKGRVGTKRKSHVWTQRIVFAFFVFIGLVVLLESPLMRVRQIVVTGNRGISSETLIGDAGLRTGMSIWQVNAGAISARVMDKQPLVQAVAVHTDVWTGRVQMDVRQKAVIGILQAGGLNYQVLDDGTVYAQISQVPASTAVPLLVVDGVEHAAPGVALHVGGWSALCRQLEKVQPNELANVSQIELKSYGEATVYLDNGFAVAGKASDFATWMSDVPDVMNYFVQHGYGPGLIDLTGPAPYRYTPYRQSGGQGK